MRLLVSVRSAAEAAAALDGGADIIDAKEPTAGALGAVTIETLREIHRAIGQRRELSAALGDATDEHSAAESARLASSTGTAFVKVGFAAIEDRAAVDRLLAATIAGVVDEACGVIAVAYADSCRAGGLPPEPIIEAAARAGARGILIDTADKNGPGLCRLAASDVLVRWIAMARSAGLLVALAGRLTADNLPLIADIDPDIAGVRGAACDDGRTGSVSAAKVRALRARLLTAARMP